jgi:arginyl-tRNA synthetase
MGGYVSDVAARIPGAADGDPAELALKGIDIVLDGVRASLGRFRVEFDRFFSERSLHEAGAIEAAIRLLEQREQVYPAEDAVWLRTTTYGDDKDRVIMRGSGEVTYFAGDIAYHEDKRERGYDRILNIVGADHHGYVERVRAAWQALGGDADRIEYVIMQLVNLTESGEQVQMSKRRGDIVTLDDLLDDIGVDAARFFLVQRSHETTLDLDLDLARSETQENPVFYVQYAHARISSILRKAGEKRVAAALATAPAAWTAPLHESEQQLVKRLLELPGEIAFAAERRAPHRLTTYALEVGQDFSAFYRDCKVLQASDDGGEKDFRICLCVQTAAVLKASLGLLGVEAPLEMHSDELEG